MTSTNSYPIGKIDLSENKNIFLRLFIADTMTYPSQRIYEICQLRVYLLFSVVGASIIIALRYFGLFSNLKRGYHILLPPLDA